jgi:hypothetical protein
MAMLVGPGVLVGMWHGAWTIERVTTHCASRDIEVMNVK